MRREITRKVVLEADDIKEAIQLLLLERNRPTPSEDARYELAGSEITVTWTETLDH